MQALNTSKHNKFEFSRQYEIARVKLIAYTYFFMSWLNLKYYIGNSVLIFVPCSVPTYYSPALNTRLFCSFERSGLSALAVNQPGHGPFRLDNRDSILLVGSCAWNSYYYIILPFTEKGRQKRRMTKTGVKIKR